MLEATTVQFLIIGADETLRTRLMETFSAGKVGNPMEAAATLPEVLDRLKAPEADGEGSTVILVLPDEGGREAARAIVDEPALDGAVVVGLLEEGETPPSDMPASGWLSPPFTVAGILDAVRQAGGFTVTIEKGRSTA